MTAEEPVTVDPALLETWRSARIWIALPGHDGLEIAPADQTQSDSFPNGTKEIHLLSAWNPGGKALGLGANERRHRTLEKELDALGLERWDAAGYSADLSWVERGFALPDIGRAEAIRLGGRFGQLAVYEWAPRSLAIVACESGRLIARYGWVSRLKPEPPWRISSE